MNAAASAARPLVPRADPAALAFDDVSHAYGRTVAVDHVSLEVRPGAVVALLGESGCGKTTLLRIAAGVERPGGGAVRLDGRVVSAGPGYLPPERRGVGLMFQDYALFPHMTVLANVLFGLKALPRAEADARARAALARVGMSAHVGRYPTELSGGQQQRVALARAIAPRPRVLLMDEPFSGLDKRLRDAVRDETVAVLRETGATAVIVTHDPEEAMRMADEIVLMRGGRVAQAGAPEALYRAPVDLFVARFFSELNELPAVVRAGRAHCALGELPAKGVPDGAAVVAVRPQGLRIGARGTGEPARIVARRFLGDAEQIELLVDGLTARLRARVRPGGDASPGTDVAVTLDASETLVFMAGGA
ncbi:iron(III) transport system ATP-binding protein [Methylopila capsulata]|uniref:Iron ABC transporter ATP-binding protein n=1 Tax=Methylopila capsulata TaxID=61654 RepID=A0A9W6IU76_9HYPH|nr:ABC transporter ATP-binding protein [Methylopila capsulata]MBM7850409.1 iron(III) transport system ATP-binding protein [Methylopila capsulata]GLK55702.1 iron ABC transporter ATP-binding protein [Methylopila capsulata]